MTYESMPEVTAQDVRDVIEYAKQVTAVAHVINHRTGRKIDLIGRGASRKQARYRALALMREGEELVEVSYEEES